MAIHPNNPISEQFRVVAKAWVEHDAAARLLEESKTATLEQRKVALIQEQGSMPDNAAERTVKASDEWHEYIEAMCNARKKANYFKVKLEYIRMQFQESQSKRYHEAQEMKFAQSGVDT